MFTKENEYINTFARVDRVSIPELELFYPQDRKDATTVIFFPVVDISILAF
jgi:hypothetical protein